MCVLAVVLTPYTSNGCDSICCPPVLTVEDACRLLPLYIISLPVKHTATDVHTMRTICMFGSLSAGDVTINHQDPL